MQNRHKNIFITGGGGYVGSKLVTDLVNKGYRVTVYDLMIFEKKLFFNKKKINLVIGDIRNIDLLKKSIKNHDVFIHLACISNDPSFDKDIKKSKDINYNCFEPIVKLAKKSGISKFIFASSSSVYGLKKNLEVTENLKLEPLTLYSKYKAECETILNNYSSSDFTVSVLRPATVCGYSKRQRLDVVVNLMTNLAFNQRKIKIFGGNQLRPNIHINDISSAFIALIEADNHLINQEIFNVGSVNYKVLDIAKIIKKIIGEDVEIESFSSDDNRSYHINSEKIKKVLKFTPSFTVEDAVKDLKSAFESGLIPNSLKDKKYFNVKNIENF